jgi:hypothetical protein
MRTSKKTWAAFSLAVAGTIPTLHAPATAQAAGPRPARAPHGVSSARIHLPDIATEWSLRQVIDGAHEWLADPSCAAVFSDFADLSGKLLSDVLADRGLTGQEQLGRLGFYDGSDTRQCRVPGVVFMTSPGYALVFVCPREFRRLSQDTPREARAMVIHEVLHTLGLHENPPAPHEITERVLERCGARDGAR